MPHTTGKTIVTDMHPPDVPQRSRRRGRRAAWLVASVVLVVLAVVGWVNREDIRGWVVGYRIFRMDWGVRVVDVNHHGHAAVSRIVSVSEDDGGHREPGRWSVSARVFVPLDVGDETTVSVVTQAINYHGDIVGYEVDGGGMPSGSAVLWREGRDRVRIDPPEGYSLVPLDMNDHGHVVGTAQRLDPGPAPLDPERTNSKAFFWSEEAGYFDLGAALGATGSAAVAINNLGTIVGSKRHGSWTPEPFVWRDGEVAVPLEVEPDTHGATATDINDSGDVLINCHGPKNRGPFLWSQTCGLRRLPELPELDTAIATSIDPTGRILLIGSMGDIDRHYVISGEDRIRLPDANGVGSTTYWKLGSNGWLAGSIWQETEAEGNMSRGFLLKLYR